MGYDDAEIYDVAILGGGVAGLIAARRLAALGRTAIVLEASDVLGGRLRQAIDPRSPVPIELGGEFVHGKPRITLDLLREYGATTIACEGSTFSNGDSRMLEEVEEDPFEAAAALLAKVDRSRRESVSELLERVAVRGDDRRTARWARTLVAGFDAADPANASAIAIAEEWTGDASADGGQSRPLGGYGALVRHLASALPEMIRVRCGARVRSVVHSIDGVRIAVDSKDTERISARASIVTLPLGMLQRDPARGGVTFDPPLEASKRSALEGLVMGPVLKVVLRFATPFWSTLHDGMFERAAFFHDERGAFPTYWTQFPLSAPTIVAWAGGPAAVSLAGKSDLIERALVDFGRALDAENAARVAFEAGYVYDWQRDELFGGAYSYVRAGGERARADLAAAAPPLFFAGEATAGDGEGGTVAGALWSGERAANEAHAYLA